jgi:hypothetical protein
MASCFAKQYGVVLKAKVNFINVFIKHKSHEKKPDKMEEMHLYNRYEIDTLEILNNYLFSTTTMVA